MPKAVKNVETPVVEETPGVENKRTVKGLKVRISGVYVHAIKGEVEYDIEFTLPRREDYKCYIKEAVTMELKKKDANVQGVITHYFDDEHEVDVPVTFFGKSPFDLTKDELFAAKCYYGLRGIKCDEDKRAAQIGVYRQICMALGLNVPQDESNVRQWEALALMPMRFPNGNTITRQKQPITFIDEGEYWIKKVIL